MRFNTKRYNISKVNPEGFIRGIHYEIKLKKGYQFSDESHLDYAEDIKELRMLIADIEEEI